MGDSNNLGGGAAPGRRSKHSPAKKPSTPGAASRISVGEIRRLRTMDDVRDERDRLYAKLDTAETRLTGELVDRQIKILRMVQEDAGAQELRDRLDKLEASNRELAARIGGNNGSAVLRADSAPAFVAPGSSGAH